MRFEEAKFKEYLLYDLLVRRGTEVYYLYWVKEFFKKNIPLDGGNWRVCLEQFLEDIKSRSAYQDWQGKQAEKAIKLYFTGFKKDIQKAQKTNGSADVNQQLRRPDGSAVLLNRFREELQCQNCGAKAERVYLNWAELFLVFVEKNTGKKPDIHSNLKIFVRRFFTYLEVNRGASLVARKQAFTALQVFFRMVFDLDVSDLKHSLHFDGN